MSEQAERFPEESQEASWRRHMVSDSVGYIGIEYGPSKTGRNLDKFIGPLTAWAIDRFFDDHNAAARERALQDALIKTAQRRHTDIHAYKPLYPPPHRDIEHMVTGPARFEDCPVEGCREIATLLTPASEEYPTTSCECGARGEGGWEATNVGGHHSTSCPMWAPASEETK